MGQLDPTREVKAIEMQIALGGKTYAQAAAELCGTDWEANFETLEDETARRHASGLDVEPVASRAISGADLQPLREGN